MYIDANVFVTPLVYEDTVPAVRPCRAVLRRIARGELEARTCTLTWDEVVWAVKRIAGMEAALRHARMFLAFPELELLPVTPAVLEAAQALAERHRLRPRDAIHAAAATVAGETEFMSLDPDFDVVPGLRRVVPTG